MSSSKYDERPTPPGEQDFGRSPALTAAVRAKDRRITELRDLVKDLIAPFGPLKSFCPWCGATPHARNEHGGTTTNHGGDCALTRALHELSSR